MGLEGLMGELFMQIASGLAEALFLFFFCFLFGKAIASKCFVRTSFFSRVFRGLFAFFSRIPPYVGLIVFSFEKVFAHIFLFLYFLPQVSDYMLRYLHGREEEPEKEPEVYQESFQTSQGKIVGVYEKRPSWLGGFFCEIWKMTYLYQIINRELSKYLFGGANSGESFLIELVFALLIYWAIGRIGEKVLPRLVRKISQRKPA